MLKQDLIYRFANEIRRSQIEHGGLPLEIIHSDVSVGDQIREVLRFEIYRTPIYEVPVEQIPKPNEYSNLDLIAWGRALVKSGRLDDEIHRSLHRGGTPDEKPR